MRVFGAQATSCFVVVFVLVLTPQVGSDCDCGSRWAALERGKQQRWNSGNILLLTAIDSLLHIRHTHPSQLPLYTYAQSSCLLSTCFSKRSWTSHSPRRLPQLTLSHYEFPWYSPIILFTNCILFNFSSVCFQNPGTINQLLSYPQDLEYCSFSF